MTDTERSRADSDTEKERVNANRHNGAAPEHDAEEETSEDQESQNQSRELEIAEQRDGVHKVEETSPGSRKRTRETESTDDAPEAKRKANESTGKPSRIHATNQEMSSYDHGHRVKLRTRVRACRTLNDCRAMLNKIPASNLVALAFALNDAKEDHRRQLLGLLPKHISSQIIDILANAYVDRSQYDPKSIFPNVALAKVLQNLPQDQRMCNICKREFEEFQDMIPKGCGKHSLHQGCLFKQLVSDESPFFALCQCF